MQQQHMVRWIKVLHGDAGDRESLPLIGDLLIDYPASNSNPGHQNGSNLNPAILFHCVILRRGRALGAVGCGTRQWADLVCRDGGEMTTFSRNQVRGSLTRMSCGSG